MSTEVAAQLSARIDSAEATVAVIGLGYVGLPLAGALHSAGFKVIGYDVDLSKIECLEKGESYLDHLGGELFRDLADSPRFSATRESAPLTEADVVILCVPTPLGHHREPDLQFVTKSAEMVASILRPGQLVVLESTTYPGTTREEVLPILASTGLTCGVDFFLAYSPEREDPGRADTKYAAISKLVGGIDEISGSLAFALYSRVVKSVHLVANAEVGEAAKLLENIYRAVNIALVNEMKVVLSHMNIDVWDVIDAAATKPFGFHSFYPGPGLGGHCIPIDPFYLTWKAKEFGMSTKFVELAGEVNAEMPSYVVSRVMSALNDQQKAVNGSRVLILGIAYKKNIGDVRETPAVEIIELLRDGGADVVYHDPHVDMIPSMRKHQLAMSSEPLTKETLAATDCVVIVTDHDAVDYELVGACFSLVVDTRNAMAGLTETNAQIVKA